MIENAEVERIIEQKEGIKVVNAFVPDVSGGLKGKIAIEVGEGAEIEWDVFVAPNYPFKVMGLEPITFTNQNLIDYPHIMESGGLCMHPAIFEEAEAQLNHDLEQLKEWVEKYYVRGEKDEHYEHLIVDSEAIENVLYNVWFAETEDEIKEGDYGKVSYAMLGAGVHMENKTATLLVTSFESGQGFRGRTTNSKLSKAYKEGGKYSGVYCMLKEAPSVHGKFIIKRYKELERLMSQSQLNYLHTFEENYKGDKFFFPLMVGYKIPGEGTHWQAAMLMMGDLPIEGYKIGAGAQRRWLTRFLNEKIHWAHTEDVTYRLFFGRGAMPANLAEKKILVTGVGAIGSMVAVTLVRCGAKFIALNDIDKKEPGNVCRSEYRFITGNGDKTYELLSELRHISPHVDCRVESPLLDLGIKGLTGTEEGRKVVAERLNEYDIIFDCTTDNQLMQVMDRVEYNGRIVNLSITNHAQDMVCVFSPGISKTVNFIYRLLGRDAETDLYNPTGCWNPTFKASYNDIASKVQFAVKHVIKMLSGEEPVGNFYVIEDDVHLKMVRV